VGVVAVAPQHGATLGLPLPQVDHKPKPHEPKEPLLYDEGLELLNDEDLYQPSAEEDGEEQSLDVDEKQPQTQSQSPAQPRKNKKRRNRSFGRGRLNSEMKLSEHEAWQLLFEIAEMEHFSVEDLQIESGLADPNKLLEYLYTHGGATTRGKPNPA